MTTRGGQSFWVKDLQVVPDVWSPMGRNVRNVGEVRDILGADFDQLVEVRDKRSTEGDRSTRR